MWKTDLHEELPAKSFVRRKQGRYFSFCRIALCAPTHTRRSIVRYTRILVALALITPAGTSPAQVPLDSLIAGESVRYELVGPFRDAPRKSEATFDRQTRVSVVLIEVEESQSRGEVAIPTEMFEAFEVARGNESWAWPLALVGGLGGCALAVATSDESDVPLARCPGGLLIGGLVGYGTGSLIKQPKWLPVEVD